MTELSSEDYQAIERIVSHQIYAASKGCEDARIWWFFRDQNLCQTKLYL